MSKGCSGISTMFAPPAMPECSAIQPAWRPITSTTRTRWWDSAVVWSRSSASVAVLSAGSRARVNVEAVDRLGGDVDRGVEAEGEVGAGEIVVDRLRDADHVDPELRELGGDAQG